MKKLQNRWAVLLTAIFLVSCVDSGDISPDDGFVDEETAVRTAVSWMETHFPGRGQFEPGNVQTVSAAGEIASYNIEFEQGGFAIVSADRDAKPIIAFSDSDSLGSHVEAARFIQNFSQGLVEGDKDPSSAKQNRGLWQVLLDTSAGPRLFMRNATMVEPFIKTKWGQSGGYEPNYTYNSATPYVTNDKHPHDSMRAPVGCAAVAFGQVLKYYDYPKRGQLTNSYCADGSDDYGCEETQVDFNRQYHWDDMPVSLNYASSNEGVEAVSELLYHVGVSLNMVYGYHGSGAKIANDNVFKGFRKHFRMSEIEVVKKSDYESDEDGWYALITDDVKAGRPIILSGSQKNVGGHAYIIDGLQENTGYVHVNWGWGGAANGYYDLKTLIIDGRYSFTEDLIAFINITPNVVGVGGACNGEGGLRCEVGLVCALNNDINQPIDETSTDETGTCLDLNPADDVEDVETEDEEEGSDEGAQDTTQTDEDTEDDGQGDAEEADEDPIMEPVVETGTVEKGAWKFFGPFSIKGGIDVRLVGTGEGDAGDADLYVRRDRTPTQYAYHCRPGAWGSEETCALSGEGNYFVAVYGYNDISEFTLTVRDTAE